MIQRPVLATLLMAASATGALAKSSFEFQVFDYLEQARFYELKERLAALPQDSPYKPLLSKPRRTSTALSSAHPTQASLMNGWSISGLESPLVHSSFGSLIPLGSKSRSHYLLRNTPVSSHVHELS